MSKTEKNLKDAFAGESQANRKYLAFAQKAEEEGFSQVAKLFRAAAEAETVHALNHLRITGEIQGTLDNLCAALTGETLEFEKMYPQFIEEAKQEENKQAAWSFDVANQVEKIHANLYKTAITALKNKQPLPNTDYYICSVCGNAVENQAPTKCPICGAPQTKFYKAP
ncbi:MAG: rubrerythrin family protein [Candidatus Bathyarchaeota archaeon]|nr:rubrerythrin family protein [Candidatus Bathyarchaeota archaeon]